MRESNEEKVRESNEEKVREKYSLQKGRRGKGHVLFVDIPLAGVLQIHGGCVGCSPVCACRM